MDGLRSARQAVLLGPSDRVGLLDLAVNRGTDTLAPPLFIIGTSRSGTSWAFDLCASHPDMSMGYESKLPVEGIEVHRRHANDLGTIDGFRRLFEDLRSSIDDPSSRAVSDLLSDDTVMEAAFEANLQRPGWATICETIFCALEDTSHWGNKLLRVELTPLLAEHWPDARFLVLIRDPRAVMASQSKKFDLSVDYSAMYWNTHTDYVLEHIGTAPDYKVPNHMVVDLLEMATDPRPSLEWAFSQIGLSTEPVRELIERFPGDPERLDKWRSTLDPERQRRIEQYCFDNMVALGYEPELATGPKRLGPARRTFAMVREHGLEILRDPGSVRRKRIVSRAISSLRSGSGG